jgi:hypothetical protein
VVPAVDGVVMRPHQYVVAGALLYGALVLTAVAMERWGWGPFRAAWWMVGKP